MKRGLSPEDQKEVLRRTADGESITLIARRLGVTRGAVSNFLDLQPAEHRPVGPRQSRLGDRKPLALSDAEIERRYRRGETLADLAAECGVREATIRRRLTDRKVPLRPNAAVREPLTLTDSELVALYEGGATLTELASRTGKARNTIRNRLANPTKSRAEQMVSRYTEGVSLRDIAAEFGIAHTTVQRALQAHGVPMRPKKTARRGDAATRPNERSPRAVSTEDEQRMVRRYEAGSGVMQLSEEFHVTPKTVRAKLAKHGVRPGDARKPIPEGEIVAKYQAGASLRDLAEEYGVSTKPVLNVLTRHGVGRRPPSYSGKTTPQAIVGERRAEAVKLYMEGLSTAAVAERLGVAKRTVQLVLNEEQVMRPSNQERRQILMEGELMKEIANRHRAGEPIRGLARELGVPESTLRKRLKDTDA